MFSVAEDLKKASKKSDGVFGITPTAEEEPKPLEQLIGETPQEEKPVQNGHIDPEPDPDPEPLVEEEPEPDKTFSVEPEEEPVVEEPPEEPPRPPSRVATPREASARSKTPQTADVLRIESEEELEDDVVVEADQEEEEGVERVEKSPDQEVGVIEGVVNGEDEVETLNNDENDTEVPQLGLEDPDLAEMVESGNMEQLAAIVLNGEGDRLVGQKSSNPEIQAFLDNVPIYMVSGKLRREI